MSLTIEEFNKDLAELGLKWVEIPEKFSLQEIGRFLCFCGKEFSSPGRTIRYRGTRSCGCLRRESLRQIARSKKTLGEVATIIGQYGVKLVGDFDPTQQALNINVKGAYRFLCHCGKEFGENSQLKGVLAGNTRGCGCKRTIHALSLHPKTITLAKLRTIMAESGLVS